jgi:hypothetical protein
MRAASRGYGEEREYATMCVAEATVNIERPDAGAVGGPTVVMRRSVYEWRLYRGALGDSLSE